MVIVLAIVAILASVVVISFNSAGKSEALDTTTVSAVSILNEAKSMAVSSKDASDYGVRIFSNKFNNTLKQYLPIIGKPEGLFYLPWPLNSIGLAMCGYIVKVAG